MSSGPPGETYFAMRFRAHTNTHQQALQAWVGRGNSEQSYYDDYARRVEQSVATYTREVAAVTDDPNSSRAEKRVEIAQLGQHVLHPAWDEVREQAFFHQYPATVKRSGSFINSLHTWRDDEMWGTKSPWELTIYDALTHPKDGSVPVIDPQPIEGLEPVAVTAPVIPRQVTEESVIPTPGAVAGVELEQSKVNCSFCGKLNKNATGRALHERRWCPKNPASTATAKELANTGAVPA